MSSPKSPALTVRFRGVRGSIPSPGTETARYGGNTSCVELRSGNEILILDAGTGIRSLGEDLAKEFGTRSIQANILLSHTHWDHIQGFPFFTPLYAAHNRIQIVGANGDKYALEIALRNQMQSPHFPVTLDELRGLAGFAHIDATCTQLGEFQIETIALNHPGGCAGFRISTRDARIAYLPDHEPYRHARNGANGAHHQPTRDELVQFVQGVDLLILDTQYTEAEYKERVGWGHGCLTDSVALAVDAGVRRLSFFHHDPSHRDQEIDEMILDGRRLARSAKLQIDAAAEKQVIVLRASGLIGHSKSLLPATGNRAVSPIFRTAAQRKVAFRRQS